MKNKQILEKFRQRIPFLKQIPDEIFFKLDHSSFHLPEKNVNELRMELEEILDHHVMAYKSNVLKLSDSMEKHLCAHLKPAKLSEKQLKTMRNYERMVKPRGVSFCVYQKPLTLIDPYESDIFKFHSNQLLSQKN